MVYLYRFKLVADREGWDTTRGQFIGHASTARELAGLIRNSHSEKLPVVGISRDNKAPIGIEAAMVNLGAIMVGDMEFEDLDGPILI